LFHSEFAKYAADIPKKHNPRTSSTYVIYLEPLGNSLTAYVSGR